MKSLKDNKCFLILVFLGLFGFSIGLFNNYRDLWMSTNGLSTLTISHINSISYFVTVLVFLFFTIRVSYKKLQMGTLIALLLKMMSGTVLICLNGTGQTVLIKFLMFFDIAFTELILSCIYPLLMNISKDDVLYTKKGFVESFSNKLGFLVVSILVGRTILGREIDYNICLLLSLIFTFLAFLILNFLHIESNKENKTINIKNAVNYFNTNKVFYLFFIVSLIGSLVWSSVLGMPMLTLTKKLNIEHEIASFMILGIGIISNILSMIVVKKLNFKNDQINIFIKYGLRVVLFVLTLITNSPILLILTISYLLLTDCIYNFVLGAYFTNVIDENYSLLFTTLKYSTSLIGNSIGTLICGMTFDLPIRYMILPTVFIGLIHYILCMILVEKKKNPLKNV